VSADNAGTAAFGEPIPQGWPGAAGRARPVEPEAHAEHPDGEADHGRRQRGRQAVDSPAHRNSVVAGVLLVALVIAGTVTVDGFVLTQKIRTMLLFGAFLGIVAIGQTLCALLGELDLAIPFVIGAAEVVMLWLIATGVSSVLALLAVLGMAVVVGTVTGLVCDR
jgi:ribose transport system permease protein